VFDELGDASVVPLLSTWAASEVPEVQRLARQALTDLHRGDVTKALIAELGNAQPAAQAEAARALGARGDKSATPRLIELARTGPVSTKKGVLQALSALVDDSQIGALVGLVIQAKDAPARAETAEALNGAYQRIQAKRGHVDAAPLVQGVEKSSTETRIALLPICSGLVDPEVRAALRAGLQDKDPRVQTAATRAACDTIDAELLPDLLQLARSTTEESVRTLAVGGSVRLVTQEDTVKLTTAQKATSLKTLLACASTPDQKRKVLAGLGEVPDAESLQAIAGTLTDPAVRNEAARAAVKVATALPGSQTLLCEETLKKALAAADEEGTREAVHAALKQIQDNADYVTNWQVAGPYRQTDKDYAALFEIAFPPESANAQTVGWKTLPAGVDPKRPWVMDLLKPLGGQQCVAYARTWIHSDRQCGATIELGSDDGVKLWLNDKPVYALNTARPLSPGSDKIDVNLHPGWNSLLLKVTQNNQGWEFCVRLRNRDGSHLEGLRCDSTPGTAPK
jgi:HEAT repeat protein